MRNRYLCKEWTIVSTGRLYPQRDYAEVKELLLSCLFGIDITCLTCRTAMVSNKMETEFSLLYPLFNQTTQIRFTQIVWNIIIHLPYLLNFSIPFDFCILSTQLSSNIFPVSSYEISRTSPIFTTGNCETGRTLSVYLINYEC